jgi:hypothetical protein
VGEFDIAPDNFEIGGFKGTMFHKMIAPGDHHFPVFARVRIGDRRDPFLLGCPRRDDYDQGRDDASVSGRCGVASNRNRDRIRAEYSGEIGQVADPRHP